LDKIAAISKEKYFSPFGSVRLREKEIAVQPYSWGLHKGRTIHYIETAGIRVAALDQPVRINATRCRSLPFLTARGGLLRLALLPRLLDQTSPHWREQTLLVNCDSPPGLLAAHLLVQETRYLRLEGSRATAVKQIFFREYGFISDNSSSATGSLPLSAVTPLAYCFSGPYTLPLPLAEALLLTLSRQAPSVSPAYLFNLSRLAAYYGFELSGS
jgi:hypothetical protein